MKYGFNFIKNEAVSKLDDMGYYPRFEGNMWSIEFKEDVRVWKDDFGRYFYLVDDTVFKMHHEHEIDNRSIKPTDIVISIFDLVDKDMQDHYRDILMKRPPNSDLESGGVLI